MAFLDGCWFTAGSSGEADFADGSAQQGYRNLAAAGAVNAATYSYRAESADRTQWELGVGAYSSGGNTLARTTVYASSNGGAKVDFSAAPFVALTPLKVDLDPMLSAIQSSLLTTRGDMIRRGASAPERFAKGSQHQVLVAGADDPAWGAVNLAQAAAVTGVLPAANHPDATTTAKGIAEIATAAEYRTGTDTARVLSVAEVWGSAALSVLTDGATIAVNFASGFDFGGASEAVLALGGNRTLGAPSNVSKNQAGILWFGASSSTRTLTLNAAWLLMDGVEVGPYSITTSQILGVAYKVRASVVYVTAILRRAA